MRMKKFLRTIRQFWTVLFSIRTKVSQTLQSVLCITTNKYLVRVLVVLLHARFSVVGPIPFLLAAIFWGGSSLYRKYYHTSRLLLLVKALLIFLCCHIIIILINNPFKVENSLAWIPITLLFGV